MGGEMPVMIGPIPGEKYAKVAFCSSSPPGVSIPSSPTEPESERARRTGSDMSQGNVRLLGEAAVANCSTDPARPAIVRPLTSTVTHRTWAGTYTT